MNYHLIMLEIYRKIDSLLNSKEVIDLVEQIYSTNKNVFPKKINIFRSFELIKNANLKVVIFGQDPYYQFGVADGLAFSSQQHKTPASLKNIFKEIKNEYPNIINKSNDLSCWAKQGVLLLNTSLTVEENNPLSHSLLWEKVIDNVIKILNESEEHLVFVLWGNNAKQIRSKINKNKHIILSSAHPSPFSANKGFFGNGHFKKINDHLRKQNKNEIDWST